MNYRPRLLDCKGNLHRWWSDSAIEAFHHRAQCLIDQYGQYVVPEVNMKLDGVNTQSIHCTAASARFALPAVKNGTKSLHSGRVLYKF
ncbi:unnamed protein product, partial [Brenthis ino]